MSYYNIYLTALLSAGAVFFFIAFYILFFIQKSPEKAEKLPRKVLPGLIVATVDLAWCIPHSKPIAPDFLINLLIPIAILALWLSYRFLDYLFARAIGGLFILSAHFFLYSSFTFHAPAKPFFSLLCYILGLTGIFFCGKPYLMRDLIRKILGDTLWRIAISLLFLIFAITFSLVGLSYFF